VTIGSISSDYGHLNRDPDAAALGYQVGPTSVVTRPSGGQLLPDRGHYEISGLACLLALNDVIPQDMVLDAESLPQIEMPNRDAWAPLPDWEPGKPRLPGYPH